MSSRYSLIQYVPSPIADERINIGVVSIGIDAVGLVYARFLKDWSRVEAFGMEDISFLKEFAVRLESEAADIRQSPEDTHEYYKMRISEILEQRQWANSIQFTEFRGSLEDPETTLETIADSCLVEPNNTNQEGG